MSPDLSHGLVDSDYNAYSNTWGYASEGSHSLALSAQDVTNALVDPANGDFHLVAGAPVIGKAQTKASFRRFLRGDTGPSWDAGAFQLPGAPDAEMRDCV